MNESELKVGTRVTVDPLPGGLSHYPNIERLPTAPARIAGHSLNWDGPGLYYNVAFDLGYNLVVGVPAAHVFPVAEATP